MPGRLQGLATVQPWIAGGLVTVGEVGNGHATAGALGDVVAGQFDVHPTRMAAQCPVHLEEPGHLIEHRGQIPGLVAGLRQDGVAVHRVTHPYHPSAGALDRRDDAWQPGPHQASPHPRDQGEPTGLSLRIELVHQPQHVLAGRGRAQLDTDRVADL